MNMRTIGLLLGILVSAVAPAHAAKLTHVIVLVRDMDASRRAFSAAGFQVEPTKPISRALLHAVIPFRDGTFLELIAGRGHTADAESVYDFVRSGDAISSAGFEVRDVYAERAALKARGFRIEPLEVSPHWIDLYFSEPAGILEPFFIYEYRGDAANRAMRKYASLAARQPDGAAGIRGIDVAVEPGLHAAATYAAVGLNGVTAVERGAGAGRIVLVHIATSDMQSKGTTIVVDHCAIRFE